MKSIYLDNNATTPLDPRVFAAMEPAFMQHFGNPASETHSYGWYAKELVTIAREELAESVGAEPEAVVFTSGATESNNLVLKGLLQRRDGSFNTDAEVVSVKTEHRAVLEPLEDLAKAGVKVHLLEVDSEGALSLDALEAALNENTALVSVMLANNEIGTIHPVAKIAEICRARGALLHCDATQGFGRLALSMASLGADFISLSAHKCYGPKGSGALIASSSARLQSLSPLLTGGGHEHGLRAGTLNTPLIVGFGRTATLATAEFEQNQARLTELSAQLMEILSEKCDVLLNGPKVRLPGNLNLSFPAIESTQLIGKVSSKLAISTSSACSSSKAHGSHVLQALGLRKERIRSSVRIGIGKFTTEEEVKAAAAILLDAIPH